MNICITRKLLLPLAAIWLLAACQYNRLNSPNLPDERLNVMGLTLNKLSELPDCAFPLPGLTPTYHNDIYDEFSVSCLDKGETSAFGRVIAVNEADNLLKARFVAYQENDKIISVDMVFPYGTQEQVLAFLVEKYGQPAASDEEGRYFWSFTRVEGRYFSVSYLSKSIIADGDPAVRFELIAS